MKKIPLTQGKFALVDDADYPAASAFNWHAHKEGRGLYYAWRSSRKPDGKKATIRLHTFLIPNAGAIHHIDGDGLNNQRTNLRIATQQQNLQGFRKKRLGTTSRFRGVSWHGQNQKWTVGIKVNKRPIYLGCFQNERDAARAYDVAARKYFGDRAAPNFP